MTSEVEHPAEAGLIAIAVIATMLLLGAGAEIAAQMLGLAYEYHIVIGTMWFSAIIAALFAAFDKSASDEDDDESLVDPEPAGD